MAVVVETLDTLTARMKANGYEAGARFPDVEVLDATIVGMMKCVHCGAVPQYVGFYNESIDSYIAYALCPHCGAKRQI